MARLVVNSPTASQREFELKQGSNFVGRARGNDIVLEDLTVSNRHCEIIVAPTSVRVRDLGSTNGTFVEEAPVTDREIQDGQALRLGMLNIHIHLASVEISIPALPAPEPVGPAFLSDGAAACEEHRAVAATYQCLQCGRMICDDCLHVLGMVGGRQRLFCPACSGACERLAAQPTSRRRFSARAIVDTLRNVVRRVSGRPPPRADTPGTGTTTKYYPRQ